MSKIKYMGGADRRSISKGADFGGQLSEPLDRDIVWNWDNNHVIDTEDEAYSGVDDTFWELLLESDDFKDVTNMKRVPTNLAQQQWRGMKKTEDAESAGIAAEAERKESGGGQQSEASDTGDATTTTGGSTSGDTTTGGSTKGKKRS